MNGQLLQSNCAPIRGARWTIDISATIGAMAAAVAVAAMIASAGDTAATRAARTTTAAFSRLSDIPSHNGAYRASLVPSSDPAGRLDSTAWTVEVQTATGAPVKDATLALESWTPDDDGAPATRARVTRYVGDGRYEVEGLRLDRRGWWNVRLQISRPGATDSLAFNLVR
jgi:YtkA-like protein